MSLLDDARRLAEPGIVSYCDFCTGSPHSLHLEGCPMLAMPRILAVVEAAERIVAHAPIIAEGKIDIGAVCAVCWAMNGHDEDCAYQAIVGAMRGTEDEA